MLKEFRDFIARGNVIDLAVAVIIGAAFGKIVNTLVEGVLMPPLGMLLGNVDFSSLFVVLDHSKGTPASIAAAKAAGIPVIAYGLFINDVVNFLILAFAVFMIVKQANRFKKAPPVSTKSCPRCLSAIPLARAALRGVLRGPLTADSDADVSAARPSSAGAAPVIGAAGGSERALVLRRVQRRLIPFAFLCYVVAYIDRVNIGFAATELQRDLHLSPSQYGFGAGLFFLAYCLFEIPSNLILERVGARRWIARILIGWGIVSMGTALVTDVRSFMAARVLLGIAEAGFFPGMVLYLTYWIPARERARSGALFMMAAPIAVIVGGPVSEVLLDAPRTAWGSPDGNGCSSSRGCRRWSSGVLALRVLTDRPEHADWLPAEDREWLSATMAAEQARRQAVGHATIAASITSGRVWILSGVLFMHTLVQYGIFLWLPKMLQDVSGTRGLRAERDYRRFHSPPRSPRWCSSAGTRIARANASSTWPPAPPSRRLGCCSPSRRRGTCGCWSSASRISQMAQRSMVGVFWALPPMFLGGTAAAAGLGLINATGNLGGFFGPTVMGWLRESTGGYAGGLLVLAAALDRRGRAGVDACGCRG